MEIQKLIDNVDWFNKKEIQWFLRFLIERNAYDAFIAEVALREGDFFVTIESCDIIMAAFLWPDDSKYGFSFGRLNTLWRALLNNRNCK